MRCGNVWTDRREAMGAEVYGYPLFTPHVCGSYAVHIDRLGYDNNFTIYDTDDQKQ